MLKIIDKLNIPLKLYMERRITLFKNEDLGMVNMTKDMLVRF